MSAAASRNAPEDGPGARPISVPISAASALRAGILMVGLLMLDHQLGMLSFELRRLIAWALLACALAAGGIASSSWRWSSPFAIAIGFVALAPNSALAIAAYAAIIAAAEALASRQGKAVLPQGLAHACLSYIAIGWIVVLVPPIANHLEPGLANLVATPIRKAQPGMATPSLSALGAPAMLLGVLYALWRWRFAGSTWRLAIAFGALAIWALGLPMAIPKADAGPVWILLRGAGWGLACAALAVALDWTCDRRSTRPALPSSPPEPRKSLILIGGLGAAIGVCLTGLSFLGKPSGRTIVVHNRGGLDWERPVYGKFGGFSSGMFGLLPVYCRAHDLDIQVIDRDRIEPGDLARAQVLTLINSPKIWEGEELQTVTSFVERGGSLLILGDHTDVFGLMKGFNSLLKPFGIQYRFDSAYHARGGWNGCLRAAPDLISMRWDAAHPGVAVGASLELQGWARPLLTGQYGFSDAGIRENALGSFLGNYHYDHGERLGDMALVATSTFGAGRVMAWGDTSSFQGGLNYTYAPVVGPMFEWLIRPASITERPPARGFAAAVIASLLAGLWLGRKGAVRVLAATIGVWVGMAGATTAQGNFARFEPRIDKTTFLIDSSHFPASGHYDARINPVGPLLTNLYRSGFRTANFETWSPDKVREARGIAFIAPQKPFTSQEIEDLLEAERQGAVTIVAASQPDAKACEALLRSHGLRLGVTPLGTVPPPQGGDSEDQAKKERPRFLDAWPILSATTDSGDPESDPNIDILFRHDRHALAVFRKIGRGGLLLISDTRFFSSMNVEDMNAHHLGNLALIHDAFAKYLGADADAVQPIFKSPQKP